MQPAMTSTQGVMTQPPNVRDRGEAAPREKKKASPNADIANPYLAARRDWDERYGDLISRAKHWRMAAFVAMAIAFIAVGGLIMVAKQTRLVPFVVAVDQLGRPVASGVATEAAGKLDERVVQVSVADFVSRWRGVTIDWTVQRALIDKVFAQIGQGSRAQVAISDWYRANPPQQRSEQGTVEIEIRTVLATTTEKTFEVEWTETKRLATGQISGKPEAYKGMFTIALNPPKTEDEGRANPLGIYVTNATWSRVF